MENELELVKKKLSEMQKELENLSLDYISLFGQLQQMVEQDVDLQVTQFHKAFDVPIAQTPCIPSDNLIRLRAKLIGEEFVEFLQATFAHEDNHDLLEDIDDRLNRLIESGTIAIDLVEIADSLADLDYVIAGTRLTYGIDGKAVAKEVHRSNMSKLGPDGKPIKREDGKIIKPASWTPPDIEGILKKTGWKDA